MGGRLLATHLEMTSNIDKGHRTVINILNEKFDLRNINQKFFSIQNMKNIRARNN
jgi:hypothetical protein